MDNRKEPKDTAPQLTIRIAKTTYVVGMYFKKDAKETMDDKVRRMIRKDITNDK